MIVRIRFKPGPVKRMPVAVLPAPETSPRAAGGIAGLLTPVAVVFGAFAAWRIAADLGLAHAFPISDGLFARWQVWFAVAAALQWAAFALDSRPNEPVPARAHEADSGPPAAEPEPILRQAG